MEGRKQVGSSSSFTSELFGSKEPSSSSGIFGAIFAPSSKELVLGRESLRSEVTGKKLTDEPLHVKPGETVGDSNGSEGESQNMPNKDMSSFYQDQRVQQPCHLSSSIYYGGQDIYSYPQSTQSPGFNSVVRIFVCFAFCFFLLNNCWFYQLTLRIRFFKNFPGNNANTV
ncbi:PREDICTED: CISIN_1g031376mg [Prunus dulcis]|uniref:PREDICTED: CISIN_1g031376mg n=1 Tax=Prunus dulcis TaxID=3755 RepID=A0A5E4FB75_PRUDU|nr:PREDICTED: CISIN_1g031376mg [Prunus dulcis]